jgi:hypothetical protein
VAVRLISYLCSAFISNSYCSEYVCSECLSFCV